jgi:hypothetical protein
LQAAEKEVKAWLKEQFRIQLKNEHFGEWISVHLEQNEQRRLRMITGELTAFAKNGD